MRAMILALCCLLPAVVRAAEEAEKKVAPPPAAAAGPTKLEEFIAERTDQKEVPALELIDPAGLERLDPETRREVLAAQREYYRYRVSGFRHRRQLFAWQLESAKTIFYVVILLVVSGIYFSGVQFHAALRRPAPGPGEAARPIDAVGGELQAGLDRIRVSSPVLGVIILVISFLFFYLYLVHVHPISDTF